MKYKPTPSLIICSICKAHFIHYKPILDDINEAKKTKRQLANIFDLFMFRLSLAQTRKILQYDKKNLKKKKGKP